jgi:hypothetical protein
VPRGRAPLGAHGGEPDAVDVGRQAVEDPAGEVQRDVRLRRSRGIRHRSIRPCKYDRKKQQPSARTHIAFINRQQNASSVGGARLHRRQTGNASNTLRARPAARTRGAEGVGTEERRIRGKECWRLTGNRRPRQGESCSSSCCSGGGGGGGPASGTAWAGLVGEEEELRRAASGGGLRMFKFESGCLERLSCEGCFF